MDFTNPPAEASTSDNQQVALSKRDLFLSTYRRYQNWALPESIIFYMVKHPSSSKVYEKLIKACKYFFIKNPILIVRHLSVIFRGNHWAICFNGKPINMDEISTKIWLTNGFNLETISGDADEKYFSTSILPKIHRSDIKKFILRSQTMSFNELKFLTSKCKEVYMSEVALMDEEGAVVPMEKLIEALPYLTYFRYVFGSTPFNFVTSKTAAEIIQIPHFPNLNFFLLNGVPETFNFDDFYPYIKKNKKTRIRVCFSHVSEAYRKRLEASVEEILQTENHEYMVPDIWFTFINQSFRIKLLNLHNHHLLVARFSCIRKKVDSSDPNVAYAFELPRKQYFCFPPDVITHLWNKPLSASGLQKLFQTCKYFFSKHQILISHSSSFYVDNLIFCRIPNKSSVKINPKNWRLWLNDIIKITNSKPLNFTKIYRCTIFSLDIQYSLLTYDNFEILTAEKTIQRFTVNYSSVQYPDGTNVTLDVILKRLPKLDYFYYLNIRENYSATTLKNMIRAKFFNFLKIFQLTLTNLSPTFDSNLLCEFIKENASPSTEFFFTIGNVEAVTNDFRLMAEEMLAAWNGPKPIIRFA